MNLILILFFIAVDQISKHFALKELSRVESIPVIPNIFHLTYVENRGAAFGILQNQKWFFVVVAVVVTVFILYYLFTNKDLDIYTKLSLILILSGAIGNVIDRVRFGFVVDFFDFRIWPVFNVADICVVIGGILLSYSILFKKN